VNVVVLVTEMTLASARDSIRLISWLKSNAPHAKIMVVANKVQSSITEISKADFEASIETKIAMSIPYDVKAAANAAKLGQTFVEANRDSETFPEMELIPAQRRMYPTGGIAAHVIGYVGRMVEEKGVVDLSAAFEALPESLGAQLLLVGDGVLRKPIEERLRRRGLDQRVFFTGRIPFHHVPSHLKCMDVLVLPSRTTGKWKEQFGHVLAEAMASGVPVIGSDSGAIPEVVGDAGLIFPEGNTGSLTDCLIRLIGNDTLREDLALRGRERVSCLYADETVAQQTYQFYRDLLG
jgi:glycosyltransferase involved in cell wall biosynthesis